jgi:glutathione synthase
MTASALRVAIQMDPIEGVDIAGDTSFRLALEAQSRGHILFVYQPDSLSWQQGRLRARASQVQLRDEPGNHVTAAPPELLDLASMDVLLMRQDPPFDMSYITATHLLEQLSGQVLVVNDPVSVRNAPEKLLVTQFSDLMPPTLISRDAEQIKAFRAEYKDIIIKPLFGNGGAGVFRLRDGDENIHSLMEMFFAQSREPVMVQAYLPEVRQGDKRIILIEGEAAGAINRVPAEGEARSNMHVGGRAEACEMTARDLEICAAIGPLLREQGLIFVGIDVIGNWLTEINVTSPTGIREIENFTGVNLAAATWQAIEKRLAGHA